MVFPDFMFMQMDNKYPINGSQDRVCNDVPENLMITHKADQSGPEVMSPRDPSRHSDVFTH